MRTRKPRTRISPESIAGWVLADILIVLFIVALGSIVPPKIEAATVAPNPTPSATPKLKPKPAAPKKTIVGMKTKPAVFTVSFDARHLTSTGKAGKSAEQSVCKTLDKKSARLGGQPAALVLIFAGGSDVQSAQRNAKAVGRQLPCANADVFTSAVIRPFWDGGLAAGKARLEIFQFTTSTAK